MSLTDFVFRRKNASLESGVDGVLTFDCSLSETHIDEAEVTAHPVEGGSETSDNIRKLPVSLEINGIVTNTPLVVDLSSNSAPSPVSKDFEKTDDRVSTAYNYLQKVMDDGTTLDVVTSLREYKSMAITSLSVIRDAVNGNVLNSSINMREIIIAGTLPTALPLPLDVANKLAENQGKKDRARASAKQDAAAKEGVKKSAAARLLGL